MRNAVEKCLMAFKLILEACSAILQIVSGHSQITEYFFLYFFRDSLLMICFD